MAKSSASTSPLVLTDEGGLGRITVDMQAFFEFSFWMAEELTDLVERERLRFPAAEQARKAHKARPARRRLCP